MANDTTFYISLPDTPVYLKSWHDKTDNCLENGNRPVLASAFTTLYIINSPTSTDLKESVDPSDKFYVGSCLSAQSLFRRFVDQEELSTRFDFVLGAKMSAKVMVGRQLYALKADDTSQTTDPCMLSQARENECTVLMYERDTKTTEGTVLWRLTDSHSKSARTIVPEVLVEWVQNPQVSPIFQENRFSPVFHDYERTIGVLNMFKESIEVQKLLDIAAHELRERKTVAQLQAMMKEPLIVVEGMDATGKTTLTEFLEEKLNAARYSTPPPCLLPLRPFFDKLPEIVRRAYYSLGNYIVAQQIAAECQTRVVLMDRYWHSTAAYGIANETSMGDLPPLGHESYCWPTDLLKPTTVIFLTVSEQVRRERLGKRQGIVTFEERFLNKDQLFRKRLCEAYLRMREPACIQVDASGSKEEVVAAVLEQLELQGIRQ
ncbi:UMP-CMP kinase 2, mitochondrial-like [Babylonia areolata]|uniref:UMP-CMP kinase 2, mitochondrial-like n=1 Tax=Babylonia areolata TaxID=304850 RepID=UPI003FD56E07